MKVKNEYVDIVLGSRKIHLKNKILPQYLSRIADRQLAKRGNFAYKSFALNYCFLKFDTILEADEPVINDFDVWIGVNSDTKGVESLGNSGTTIKYNYSDDNGVYDLKHNINYENNGLQNFIGKKITAIAFNSRFNNSGAYPNSSKMCAILDTSNYNIVINEDERLLIVRKDIITSDAQMITEFPEIIKAPIHLRPYGLREIESLNPDENLNPGGITYTSKQFANAYLESIGLGFDNSKMYQKITGIQKTKEGEGISILDYFSEPFELPNLLDFLIYPDDKIFPNNELYPVNKRYTCLFFNYRVYQMQYIYSAETGEQLEEKIVDTGYTYSMVVPLEQQNGKFEPVIFYESEETIND